MESLSTPPSDPQFPSLPSPRAATSLHLGQGLVGRCFVKGQIVNHLCSVGLRSLSVDTTQLCHCSVKAARFSR